jgi:NADPH2:quinone reductase
MKAIRIEGFGGPDVLRLTDVPVPSPGPGQIAVRVEAAGVNFIDVYHRIGLYPNPLPLVPGMEGAGGVGLLLVQMAKRRGARVIGTVGTEAKAALAREAGADEVILYTQEDFLDAVRRLTGGRGVEVVYDSVGKTTAEKSLDCLVPRGMAVFYGNASGPVPPIDPLVLSRKGSLFLTRPSLVHYIADRASLEVRAADVLGDAAAGRLKVRIDRIYPLSEAAEAHRALEARLTTGKVLLIP